MCVHCANYVSPLGFCFCCWRCFYCRNFFSLCNSGSYRCSEATTSTSFLYISHAHLHTIDGSKPNLKPERSVSFFFGGGDNKNRWLCRCFVLCCCCCCCCIMCIIQPVYRERIRVHCLQENSHTIHKNWMRLYLSGIMDEWIRGISAAEKLW